MVTRDQVGVVARAAFLAVRPRLQMDIAALTEEEACGGTLEEYQTVYFQRELTAEAKRQGLSGWDFQLRLAEKAGLDVSMLREEDRRAVADHLGIDRLL